MIVTTYTCDKCGHAQNKNDQMWDIGVVIGHHASIYGRDRTPASIYGRDRTPNPVQLWCRDCIEELGLLPPGGGAKDAPPLPDPPPTLEDMIREIVRQETTA